VYKKKKFVPELSTILSKAIQDNLRKRALVCDASKRRKRSYFFIIIIMEKGNDLMIRENF